MSETLFEEVQKFLEKSKRYRKREDGNDFIGTVASGLAGGAGGFVVGGPGGAAAGSGGGAAASEYLGSDFHREIGDSFRKLSKMAGYLDKRRQDRSAGHEPGALDPHTVNEGYEALRDLQQDQSSPLKHRGYDYWNLSRKLANDLRRKADYEIYDEIARDGVFPKGSFVPGSQDDPLQAPRSRAPKGLQGDQSPKAPKPAWYDQFSVQTRSKAEGRRNSYLHNPPLSGAKPRKRLPTDPPNITAPSWLTSPEPDASPTRPAGSDRQSDASGGLNGVLRKVRSRRYRDDPDYQRKVAMEIGRYANITPLNRV